MAFQEATTTAGRIRENLRSRARVRVTWTTSPASVVRIAFLTMAPTLAITFWLRDPRFDTISAVPLLWVTRDILVLLAAGALYATWRLSTLPMAGWYVVAYTTLAIGSLPFDLVSAAAKGAPGPLWANAHLDLLALPPFLLLLLLGSRGRPLPARMDPLLLAVLVASVVSVAQATIGLALAGRSAPDPTGSPLVVLVLVAATTAVCFAIPPASGLPGRVTPMLGLTRLTLVLTQVGMSLSHGGAWALTISLVGTGAAVMLAVIATTILQHGSVLWGPRVDLLPLQQRDDLLHELRSTLGSVSMATHLLLGDGHGLQAGHRSQLASMLESELERARRLLERRTAGSPKDRSSVELDRVIEPLVVMRRALGTAIIWHPTGRRVLGDPDDIAEAIHILLDNAVKHAPGAPIMVTTLAVDHSVELRVHDTGHGLAAERAEALFDRGARGPGSDGQGIGLDIARRLVRGHGGDLRFEDGHQEPGATFVITLPAEPVAP